MRKLLSLMGIMLLAYLIIPAAGAYEIPRQDSNVNYFYVFGPDGDPLMGAEDHVMEIVVDVPESSQGPVLIQVFDPDTGGKKDWRTDENTNPWNTKTEFTVSGRGELGKKVFGQDEYDQAYYTFGPYEKNQGDKVGSFYRFKLTARGLSGDDENLFKVQISPEDAESYSNNITFRLLQREGDEMFFYPEVPQGTSSVTVHNYDLDEEGGTSSFLEGSSQIRYDVLDSKSGQWVKTDINLASSQGGRQKYIVTKKYQRHANAGLKVTDASGKDLPIYFRRDVPPPAQRKPRPVAVAPKPDLKCNTYVFDARSSYDDDGNKLDYLWEFGDGQTSSEAVTRHTYAKAGNYTVTLKVTDNSGLKCNTAVTTETVLVNTPPSASFKAPDAVCVGQEITIDASASTDDTPKNLSYDWSLGDGQSADSKVLKKTYERGGVYKVALKVDDNAGTACSVDSADRVIRVNTPPVAIAGKDITVCKRSDDGEFDVRLSASGSRDADGDSLDYTWDFGDGERGMGSNVTHVYKSAGNYRAQVTVDDGSGLSCNVATDTIQIALNNGPVANAGRDLQVCSGQQVKLDASGSTDKDGDALKYSWDLGDGNSATGKNVTHTYAQGGKYPVKLLVDDQRGMACSGSNDALTVDVNSNPSVSLNQGGTTCTGRAVNFKAEAQDADRDNLTYTWDFGDGEVASGGSSASHAYSKGGSYTVRVTVDDGKGSPCSLASTSTNVKVNTPPVADAGQNLACCVDQGVTYDASGSSDADGDKLTYRWSFGDGSSGEGKTVTHVYTANGDYKVVLTVDDGSGTNCSRSSSGFTARVNQKPVPVIKIQ